jgi:hypothetical protein
MYKTTRNTVMFVGILTIIVLGLRLPTWSDRIVFSGLGIIVFTLAAALIGERIRRTIEGHYTYMSGGAEEGDLVYTQGDKALRLYFKRRPHTIYVPSNNKWMEIMPEWARENRDLIVKRIKDSVGKHWTFEDTEKQEHIMTQK